MQCNNVLFTTYCLDNYFLFETNDLIVLRKFEIILLYHLALKPYQKIF